MTLPHDAQLPQSLPPHAVMEQAAHWFAVLRSEDVSAQQQSQWQRWLDADEAHRIAWRYVQRIGERFEPLQSLSSTRPAVDAYKRATSTLLRRRQVLTGVVAVAGSGVLAWAGVRQGGANLAALWSADHRTATGEIRQIELADGTGVWLGTASALAVDFQPHWRRLRLFDGEVLVQTAADSRPFLVETPHGAAHTLGTHFNVRLEGAQTAVAVFDGAVEVRLGTGARTLLQAQQQLHFGREALGEVSPADPAREAWSRGVLIAQDITLAAVVKELRRYRRGHLGLAPEVAGLRVVGSFPLDDPQRSLAMLESVLPVRVHEPLPWWTSIGPAEPNDDVAQ